MSSKSKTTQTAQTNATPWNADQLKSLYGAGWDAYGKTQATASGYYDQAAKAAADSATQMGASAQAGNQLIQDQIAGKYLGANPYLDGAITAAIDPLQRALLETTLPSIMDQSIAQGAYGGTRNAVAQTKALADFNHEAGNIAASMAGENYSNERNIQQQSLGMLGTLQNLLLAPSQALATAGGLAEQGSSAGLELLAKILGVGPNAVNTTSSGTGTTTTSDPLGWFKALTAAVPTGG